MIPLPTPQCMTAARRIVGHEAVANVAITALLIETVREDPANRDLILKAMRMKGRR